jgi:hypothetical protein
MIVSFMVQLAADISQIASCIHWCRQGRLRDSVVDWMYPSKGRSGNGPLFALDTHDAAAAVVEEGDDSVR